MVDYILGLDAKNFSELLQKLTFPAFLVLIVLAFFNLEKFSLLAAMFLRMFEFFGTGVKRKRISAEIKSNILKISKKANKEFSELLPHDIEINWVKSEDREAFFRSKKVVVLLSDDDNEVFTIVKAIHDYVKCAVLEQEKELIDEEIYHSTTIAITNKLLKHAYKGGVSTFFSKIVAHESDKNMNVRELFGKLIDIDDGGLFMNIFISELKESCSQQFGRLKNEKFNQETKELIDFLLSIANRAPGEYGELIFQKTYYKVAIILCAKRATITGGGTAPYVKRYTQYALDGFSHVYFFAKERTAYFMKKVIQEIETKDSCKKFKHVVFNGRSSNGILYIGECYKVEINKE